MTAIKRSEVVNHSAKQMFDLVNRVEDYPQFLSWCIGCDLLSRNEDEVRATLHLSRGGLTKSFTTCNRMQQDKMIEMRLVSGPFKHLHGFWRFEPLSDQQCRVSLDMEFEFQNRLISFALDPIFQQIANTLVDNFCARAKIVYLETPNES